MKPVSYLQGIRKYFLNGGGIGAGTVTCYCLDLFIVEQPFFKSRTVSSVKYCNQRVSRFIYDNGSVSMLFLKAKSSTPITLSHFAASWRVYRFVSGVSRYRH